MAVIVVAGTTAELIKLAPVMRALQERGDGYRFWNTAQHVDGLRATLADLGLPAPDEHFLPEQSQQPLVRVMQVPGWALRVLGHAVRHRRRLQRQLNQGSGLPLVIVHGDTFTTVLGSLVGRLLGARVAHVEAGMRSGNIWHPMPEELNRRVAARLVRLHFAPSPREAGNLERERVRGRVVDTGANTVVDALRMMADREGPPPGLPDRYGLVTLHRFELLRNAKVFTQTLELLHEVSRDKTLVMLAGDTERNRIEEVGLLHLFDERFRLLDKQPYARFLPILARSDFVVTDSGGLQEECAVIGKPCAVQREATERYQGLGQNVLLTRFDMDVLRRFVDRWEEYQRPSQLGEFGPTEVIMTTLVEEGHLASRTAD